MTEFKNASILTKNVIVADDTEELRFCLKDILTEIGINVFLCANGNELMKLIKNKELKYDLIILDLFMPGIDGIDVLQKIQILKKQLGFKVFIISGHRDQKLIEKAIKLNADDFLLKPFDNEMIINRIQNLLNLNKLDLKKYTFLKEPLIANLTQLPTIMNFKVVALSEVGLLIESIINFKEQSIISFSCAILSQITEKENEFDIKIIKSQLEKDKFLIAVEFFNLPEMNFRKLKIYIIKISNPLFQYSFKLV